MRSGGQENIKWLIELSRELGRPLTALQDMPELMDHLFPYWEAFDLLSPSRQFTMGGAGPVPLSEIITYMQWEGVATRDEQKRFVRLVRALDFEYLAMNREDHE